ncbi:hypothetical protein [Mycolicibacterium sediminis]|nr:hypothetical protein [Mycolicibacterium sediminis]
MKTSGYLSLAFIFAILMGGGGFTAIWTAIWFARGSLLTATLCSGASLLLFSILFHLAFPLTGAAHPRAEHGAGGTTVRPQRYADRIFSAGLLTGVLSAIAFLVFSQFGLVDFIPSNVNGLVMPAACIFYVVYGVPTLYRSAKYRDGKHLRLNPEGFEVWDSQWNSYARRAWDDVEQIRDHPLKGRTSFTEMIVFVLPKNRSAKLGSGTITANSDALLQWTRFYWQHPEYRDELTDARALQRLHDEKFTVQ